MLLVAFLVLAYATANSYLYGLILGYLSKKPRGRQTFLDALNIDLLQIMRASTIFLMTLHQI